MLHATKCASLALALACTTFTLAQEWFFDNQFWNTRAEEMTRSVGVRGSNKVLGGVLMHQVS